MEKKEQLYEGKAKKVYATEDPNLVIVSYKDDATAFDGAKKGTIVGKGVINNQMSNRLMAYLEKQGIPTHFVKELPERDDDFAKDVSEYDTLDERKDSIRKGIETNHEKQADQKVENDLIDQVVGGMKAEIPAAMIESRIEELVQDFQYRISQQGLKLEQYLQYMGMTMDQFKEQFREQADKQVKMRLAMEAIVAKESIEATEEEFEAEIKRIADAYQMEADKVKSLVDAAAVKKDLAVNKAIDFVKEKANIVLGAAEEKKPAKKTTRKTTKKAAAKKDEEPKEEEKGE